MSTDGINEVMILVYIEAHAKIGCTENEVSNGSKHRLQGRGKYNPSWGVRFYPATAVLLFLH